MGEDFDDNNNGSIEEELTEEQQEVANNNQDNDRISKKLSREEKKEAETRRLNDSLDKMPNEVKNKMFPFLSSQQSEDLKNGAKNPKTWEKWRKAIAAYFSKLREALTTFGPPIFQFLLIMAAIFVGLPLVIAVITWPIKWLLWPDDTSTGDSGASAAFGVTGKDFYGVRTIYKNDEKARAGLLEDYSAIIEDSINETLKFERVKTEIINEGTPDEKTITYKITIEIDLTIPTIQNEDNEIVEYDYSKFDEETFKTEFVDYYNLINSIAEKIYIIDNPNGVVPATLTEKLDGIKYFGLDEANSPEVKTIVNTKFLENYQVKVYNETDDVYVDEKISEYKTEFLTDIETALADAVDTILANYTNRAEKLFIKDYTFKNEDDMMKGIAEENYITWIFMPKNAVEFKKISFFISHKDLNNFSIKVLNNSSEIELKKDDGNMGDENNPAYSYVADNISVNASVFEDIDTTNLEALASGLSLAEIIRNPNLNTEKYLQLNEQNIYTTKSMGVHVDFGSEIKFRCVELETLWK